jgi:predicted ribosome quality control (RQC) complex YloA/Tae2 family protein
MPLDGVCVKCLADELSIQLANARVDRISQPDRLDIILLLHREKGNFRLLLSANPAAPRIHLTMESRENPNEAPMFCMLLRKHLIGARLVDAVSPDFERMIRLRFDAVNELGDHVEKSLMIEMMGKHSNIILLNREDKIHDAIVHVDASISRVREILPARPYVQPPGQNKLTPQAALSLLKENSPLFSADSRLLSLDKALLQTLQGFSPQLCQEILLLADCESSLRPMQLDDSQMARLRFALARLLETVVQGRFSPTLFFSRESETLPLDFHALCLHGYPVAKSAASLSQAMDCFYLEKIRQNTLLQKKQHLARLIGRQLDHVRKKKAIHELAAKEGSAYAQHRLMGDLILSNLHTALPEQSFLSAIDYNQPDLPAVIIPLQTNLTASQNAQRYYKLYSKAKAKYGYGQRLAAEDTKDIAYLESVQCALEAAFEQDDLFAIRQEIQAAGFGDDSRSSGPGPDQDRYLPKRRSNGKQSRKLQKGPARSSSLTFRRYASSDGMTILAGRNNLQNDQLTLKTAQKGDIWLHVQKMPGTHVIVQANHLPVPERTLLEAAAIAAWFSRASLALPADSSGSSGLKVAVDYCPASHVRKPAGARPGMVIYENYQTVLVTPQAPRVPEESSP